MNNPNPPISNQPPNQGVLSGSSVQRIVRQFTLSRNFWREDGGSMGFSHLSLGDWESRSLYLAHDYPEGTTIKEVQTVTIHLPNAK